MHDVFDAVPVADNRVGLGDFAVDSSHAGFERVSLHRTKNRPSNFPSAHSLQSERDKMEATHSTLSSGHGIRLKRFRVFPGRANDPWP